MNKARAVCGGWLSGRVHKMERRLQIPLHKQAGTDRQEHPSHNRQTFQGLAATVVGAKLDGSSWDAPGRSGRASRGPPWAMRPLAPW